MPFPKLPAMMEADIVDDYRKGAVPVDLAAVYDLTVAHIIFLLNRHGIPLGDHGRGRRTALDLWTPDEIQTFTDMCNDPFVPLKEICVAFNISYSQLYNYRIKLGISPRSHSAADIRMEEAYEMYEAGAKLTEIWTQTGVCAQVLYTWMARHGHPTRMEVIRGNYRNTDGSLDVDSDSEDPSRK